MTHGKYKKAWMNEQMREAVKTAKEYMIKHPSKAWTNLKKYDLALNFARICKIPFNRAEIVVWFLQADEKRNQAILKEWGFNKDTV